MANDKIMVTVTVPEGLRAVVEMWDTTEGGPRGRQATVIGGTSRDFFADKLRQITISEGEPHYEAPPNASEVDRKPDSE